MKYRYLLIIFIGVLFLSTFNFTTSRYIGELQSNNEIVAIPILTLNNNQIEIKVDDMLPGETREVPFVVSNKENGQLNEVLLNYNITITPDNVIPIKIELYNDKDEKIVLTDNKSSEEQMPYDTEATRNYKLKIIWDEKDNDYTYANKTSHISVELTGTQVIE